MCCSSLAVDARYWGPGRFRAALRATVDEGYARQLARDTYAPPDRSAQSAEQ
jgi:hypothetical protein